MATTPLMPKATAVWLVENTALSFDQIADFCKLHPLEVKAIADGDAAQGIKGMDPISTSQLSRDEIEKAEADPSIRLHMSDPKVRLPEAKKKKGPRYTPVSWSGHPALDREGPDAYIAAIHVIADDNRLRPEGRAKRRGDLPWRFR